MESEVQTIVNFTRFASGNEFNTSNPAGILPYLRATEQHFKSTGPQRYQWRTCGFRARALDETRFLPTLGLVSSSFICDEISGDETECSQLLNKLIAASERYNAALIFAPISRSYLLPSAAKKDSKLVKIASELFSERLKRTTVESELNRSIPLFLYRSEGCPLYAAFDAVVEKSNEAK